MPQVGPFTFGEGQPPAAPTPAAAPPTSSVVQPGMPAIYMDPVTQKNILAQAQRSGWNASQPTPDVQIQTDNITGQPTVTVKGWNMMISDPTTGATQQIELSYSPGGKQPWGITKGPGDLPKTTTAKTPADQATTVGGVLYQPDPKNPGGPWIAVTPDADAKAKAQTDIAKALSDIGYTSAQITALQQKTGPEIAQILASTNLSAAQQQKVINDIAVANAELPGKMAQTAASTAYTQTQTENLAQATQLATQKAPYENELLKQQAENQRQAALTAAQQRQIAAQPNIVQPGTGMYTYTQDPLTGKITPSYNANYQAKTVADVAGRVSQLQTMAQDQRDQISARLQSGEFGTGPDAQQKAAAAFDSWWSQNVESQKAALTAAQSTAQQEQQRLLEEQQRANVATAQTAGQAALTAAAGEVRHGPGFGAALANIQNAYASGKAPAPMSAEQLQAAVTPAPLDYNKIYEQATAQALAHISPTAAQIATGQPVPTALGRIQGMDINEQLNRQRYAFGGAPLAQAAPPPAAPAPLPPVNQVPGQNYGAATAYTGGIPPWLAQPVGGQYVYGGG